MTAQGFRARILAAFLGIRQDSGTTGVRGREGYTFGQRCLASFLRIDLPARAQSPAPQAARPVTATRRPGSPWFDLPMLHATTTGVLMAASTDRIAAALSPDLAIEYSLERDNNDGEPGYLLEAVLRVPAVLPAAVAVAYTPLDGAPRIELLIPIAEAKLGPAAGRIRLPGFRPGAAWEATALMTSDELLSRGESVIIASLAAAANHATREAWSALRAGNSLLQDLLQGAPE